MLIEGSFAAVTTPFYPDERVYHRKIEANMAHYSRTPLAGMVVLGSTGEAVTLDDAETRDVLRTAAGATSPEKVLIAGVGRESLKATVEMAEAAAQFEYDAVLVRTPTYYSPQISYEAALTYFRSVADRSPLPVLLYHIPKFVPYPMPVELVAELAQHPNIIGIKDSSGDLERIKATIASTRTGPKRTVTVTNIFEAVTARIRCGWGSSWRYRTGRCASEGIDQDAEQRNRIPSAYRSGLDCSGVFGSGRGRRYSRFRRVRSTSIS
jgi:dihydrodipicolinate synthase/N-acetylneuraminate lyase